MSTVLKTLKICVYVILAPVFIALFAVFMVLWLVWTLSGIGPITQCYCASRDKKLLDPNSQQKSNSNFVVLTVPGDIHSCSKGQPYSLFAIFAKSRVPSLFPPVCIPNGLGANAVLISKIQESLVAAGFDVLSFDRLGVGFSDENVSHSAPTATDVVNEMEFVMSSLLPPTTKWILLGPSMGSIVAQCYISLYPDKVVGFMNMDGLPYPFIQQRNLFAWAGFIYKIYASIIWTGILRPFIGMARKDMQKMFGSESFSVDVIVALMNQRRFFANVALEMDTMMDCCAMAERAWGSSSLLKMSPEDVKAFVCAAPNESIAFSSPDDCSRGPNPAEWRAVTSLRSASEVGDAWSSEEEVQTALSHLVDVMTAKPSLLVADAGENSALLSKNGSSGLSSGLSSGSILGEVWGRLVVRVISARCHDFGNAAANAFYTQEMRDMAAAEHAIHALCARDGARSVYPQLTHTVMFTKTSEIVKKMLEIGDALVKIEKPSSE